VKFVEVFASRVAGPDSPDIMKPGSTSLFRTFISHWNGAGMVFVGIGVGMRVGIRVGVCVGIGDGVDVGKTGVEAGAHPLKKTNKNTNTRNTG
jgi:hypothetical protein